MTWGAAFRRDHPVDRRPLAGLTTIRIGGEAEVVTITSSAGLVEARSVPHRFLGKGANLVVADHGVAEAVLRLGPAFSTVAIDDAGEGRGRVRIGAAADLAKVVAACGRAGLAGPEGLAGVPATVGGALRMNAGTRTLWMFDLVERVEVLLPGEGAPRWLLRDEVPAAYRTSGLPAGTWFLGCEWLLERGEPGALQAEATRLRQAKAASQPLAERSAGCAFKNPSASLAAGRVVDELGLKGTRHGGAEISTVHGNFIVNRGGATAADFYALVRLARQRARDERGIELELEVEMWNPPGDLERDGHG